MPSANTPASGQSISFSEIYNVFGSKGSTIDVNDYAGEKYYDSAYPYGSGRFTRTGPLSFSDFYNKTTTDPITPGSTTDFIAGSNKAFTIPLFRNQIRFEIWGAGGGAGAADHDSVRPSGGSGGTSSIVINSSTLTSTGGGGGTSGYRYGTQNGTGGGGGTASNTGAFTTTTIVKTNGNSGGNGNAENGSGANGGTAPPSTSTSLSTTYAMFLSSNPTITSSTFNIVLSYYITATARTFVNSGTNITYYSLNRKPDYNGLKYWCLQYQSDPTNFTRNFYFGIGTSDNQYYDFTYSRAPRPTLLTNGTSSDFIDIPTVTTTSGTGGAGGALGAHNINNKNGSPGKAPGGGGGSGGYSDFQSGKNANPNRAAGGSGGSGAYSSLTFTRAQITPGLIITYTVGGGGPGSTGNLGNGAAGASGGFKATWN